MRADALKTGSINGRMTLSELVAEVIRTNPDIGITGAHEKEQFAGIRLAEAAKYPTIDGAASAGPQHVYLPTPEGDMIRRDASISIKQTIFDFGAAKNDISRAEKAYDSATSARLSKSEEVAFNMMNAYLKVQQADEMIAVVRSNIDAHQRILGLVQLSQENGNSTVADTKRITTRLETARTTLVDLKTSRSDAADSFRNITGVDVSMVDGSAYDRLDGDPSSLTDDALDHHPSVVSIQQEIDSLKYQLASLKAGKLPLIGLQGAVRSSSNVNEEASTDKSTAAYFLATVRVPLYDGGVNDSQQEQILARIDGAMLRLEKQRRELREAAKNAARAVQADGDKSSSLASRVDAARKVADLYFEQYQDGGKSIFDLLDSQSEYFKARSDLIEQKFTRRKAQMSALQLRGKLVENLLSLSPRTAGLTKAKLIGKPNSATYAKQASMQGLPPLPGLPALPTTTIDTVKTGSTDNGLPGVKF